MNFFPFFLVNDLLSIYNLAMDKKLKYTQLMDDLKNQILSGQIKAGEKLPSENVLSSKYAVSRQTVRKALHILENEDYVYAEHGRGTFCSERMRHLHQSKNIAVITTYLSDYIFPHVIQGIDQVLTDNGYSIVLKNTKNSRTIEARILQELLEKDIDGLIIEPSKSHIFCKHMGLYHLLDQYRIPYVFIQGSYSQMSDKPHILMDDRKGGYLITTSLIDTGHRHLIGVFKSDDMQGQERHRGFVDALKEAGIPYDADKVIWFYTEDRHIHPYEKTLELASNREQDYFDGVVCYNDQTAIEVMRALKEKNLSVPEDVSVTGYDNSYLAETCMVPLTTIAHPQERLGKMAAELLLKIISQKEASVSEKQIKIEPEIIIRDSVSLKSSLAEDQICYRNHQTDTE